MEAEKDDSYKRKRNDEEGKLDHLCKYLYQLVQLGVNLRQDWFFHIVFGRDESVPFLRELMNGVLRNANEPPVGAIKIKNPFMFGDYLHSKDVVVDVAVEDDLGNQYDVEMQAWSQKNFRERIVYYLERIASSQLSEGEGYDKLRKVVGIIFVDFPIWSEFDLKKIKNLTPDLAKNLKETQFETIKLMSVDSGVVFSECLTLYFVRIPEANEPFSPKLCDPKLIDWLKAFRFPESTSEKDMLQIETSTPEIKELRKQMLELLATEEQRAYIESRRRAYLERKALQEEYVNLRETNSNLRETNSNLLETNSNLLEQNGNLREKFRNAVAQTAASKFSETSVLAVKSLLEGCDQETLDAAFESLLSNANYDEFVKVVSKAR